MTIIEALQAVDRARFRCGRVPCVMDGTYVHEAFRICERSAYPVAIEMFTVCGLPIDAIAEAVRIGVLAVEPGSVFPGVPS